MKAHFLITALALAASGSAYAQTLSGPATAIDGRTLDMTGTPIRLAFVDAPEDRQSCKRDNADWACGRDATASLAQIVRGQMVKCTVTATDDDHVKRAICEASGLDIGREMVRRGMAVTTEYAPLDYEEAEGIAESLAFGVWQGAFDRPDEWRAANPEAALHFTYESVPAPTAPRGSASMHSHADVRHYSNELGCTIKGNHSRHGDWIYHLPGQRYYAQTRPEELFCTEEAARAAGYRRSKQ